MKKILLLFLAIAAFSNANAKVALPHIFGENMVLQQNQPIRIWGWAAANEKVQVLFDKQKKVTKADKLGKWQLMLEPELAGGPFQLVVKGENELVIKNVLVGEVWVCGGQSNMEMPLGGWGEVNNFKKEIAEAEFPLIRQFEVPHTVSTSLAEDVTGGNWQICSSNTAQTFSATAYFFARELFKKLNVPIGIIHSSSGGTQIEAWTSQKGFAQNSDLKYISNAMKLNEVDSIFKNRKNDVLNNIKHFNIDLNKNTNPTDWKTIEFDDSNWPVMKLPRVWETQGLKGFDGTVWFRYKINLTAEEAKSSAFLVLSKVDDIGETYINGIMLGTTSGWNVPIEYTIPSRTLKAGVNVIAIKVVDYGGLGGIWGEPADMKIKIGEKTSSLAGTWKFNIESVNLNNKLGENAYPSLLFNGMIHPLLKYSIKGVIWYQGEANAPRAYQYRTSFPAMIKDWRTEWKQGDFPFLFVQLSSFGSDAANSNNGSSWAELREAQALALNLPNTGMAVTTDIGNAIDVHPKNKQDVGKRLAAVALHDVYNKPVEYTGPVYKSMKIIGDSIEISFTYTGAGLYVNDKYGYIKGFEISGADKKFQYAKAIISGNKIVVYCNKISNPVAVRYNWADDASDGNIFNKELFPLAPFRTDDWEGVTTKVKYTFELL